MKIGGYKNNANSNMDIDLTPVVDTSNNNEPVVNEPVNNEPVVETPAAEEVNEPVIQDTSKEIQETGQFDKPKVTETAEDADKGKSSLNTQTNSEPVVETPNEPVVEKNVPVEISDELHFKYLSEKLGREVKSLDDLTKADNPLDSDPYLKELAAWREKTGRPIEDWVKFQKDYTKVSDVDVAREFLQIEFPELTPEEIELEVSQKFLSSEDDLDRDIALKNLELKKYASKGRKELGKLVSELGNPNPANLTPEIKQDLAIAKEYKTLKAQIDVDNKTYNENIVSKAAQLKSIKLDLAEGVSLDFKLPDNAASSIVKTIQDAPKWKNEDGSWNHEAIVRDTAIVENLPTMLKLAYEQGKNSGTDEVIQEAKNTTLGNRNSNESVIPTGNKGVQIEGLDKYLGKKGMSIIRGR